jgi:hypothetical protein
MATQTVRVPIWKLMAYNPYLWIIAGVILSVGERCIYPDR